VRDLSILEKQEVDHCLAQMLYTKKHLIEYMENRVFDELIKKNPLKGIGTDISEITGMLPK